MELRKVGGEPAEPPADLFGLHSPASVQRNVLLALKARLRIPVGLTMPDEIDRAAQDEPSRSSEMSGAAGFFIPTT